MRSEGGEKEWVFYRKRQQTSSVSGRKAEPLWCWLAASAPAAGWVHTGLAADGQHLSQKQRPAAPAADLRGQVGVTAPSRACISSGLSGQVRGDTTCHVTIWSSFRLTWLSLWGAETVAFQPAPGPTHGKCPAVLAAPQGLLSPPFV